MSAQHATNTQLRIVLVEDSPLIRQLMVEMLDGFEYAEVVGYAEGQNQALNEIEACRPDLVIVDLELVEGDGLGVLRALKEQPERFGDPHKIVYTNHISPQLRKRCHMLDIEGYFDKSYQLDELMGYIQELAS